MMDETFIKKIIKEKLETIHNTNDLAYIFSVMIHLDDDQGKEED